jgi:hypothetical protein
VCVTARLHGCLPAFSHPSRLCIPLSHPRPLVPVISGCHSITPNPQACLLLELGADVDATCCVPGFDVPVSATMLACARGNVPVLEQLLARGSDVNTPDSLGRTPLMFCCRCVKVGGQGQACTDTALACVCVVLAGFAYVCVWGTVLMKPWCAWCVGDSRVQLSAVECDWVQLSATGCRGKCMQGQSSCC